MTNRILQAKAPKIYPKFQLGPGTSGINLKKHSLTSVKQILASRFPYLNLTGLAGVADICVSIISKRDETFDEITHHAFNIFYRGEQCPHNGSIELQENSRYNTIATNHIYPNLPRIGNLGVTILFLILVRGNTFAGKKVEIKNARTNVKKMASKMEDFSPEVIPYELGNESVFITVPELSKEEIAAVEWLWINVLRCPAI